MMKGMSEFSVCLLLILTVARVSIAQVCSAGRTFNDHYGSFEYSYNPTFAGYGVDRKRSWKIMAPLGEQVDMRFSSFKTATCINASSVCTCTYLVVKDGECSNSTLIGEYCGTQNLSQTISSTGRYLRIEFVSYAVNSTRIIDHFNVNYSRVTTCRTSPISLPLKCPNQATKLSHNTCCVVSGESSCCFFEGNNCTDDGINHRSYCPRTRDSNSKTACCVADGRPSCCESGGNYCDDEGVNIRSYCPSTDEEKGNGSVVCCITDSKPACCPEPPPEIPPACKPIEKLFGGVWTTTECVVLWCGLAAGVVVIICLVVLTCYKWPCYHCLLYPIQQCLPRIEQWLEAVLRRFLQALKWIAFGLSLFVTTIVFTFACCCCFVVIQEWPWKASHRIVSRKFGFNTGNEIEDSPSDASEQHDSSDQETNSSP